MLYNKEEHARYVLTAGKISVAAAVVGLAVFFIAFIFDAGNAQLNRVLADTASTSLTVLNTPPSFTVNAYETIESSTTTPTNSGSSISWSAIGTDTNGAPYFLLICSTNASPTANAAAGLLFLGTEPPECGGGIQWGVSASTNSGAVATVSTTTTEVAPFAESNNWYAWVCDDDPTNPRCNNIPVQGYSATNSSPFNVNFRPVFTSIANDGPADPGENVVFTSVSSDPDVVDAPDEIYLVVCETNTDYDTNLNTCPDDFIASTTISFLANAAATYTLPAIIRDNTYASYTYIVDEHGHEASANPRTSNFVVNNVAPTVIGGDIDLNGGLDLVLTNDGATTSGYTLDFTIRDANSCLTAASTSEITNYTAVVFRSSVGTTSCNGTAGSYDPNDCYPSGVGQSVWDLDCSASACLSPLSDSRDYTCTFDLWFLADPTDNGVNTPSSFEIDHWSAGIAGSDDDFATSTMATTTMVTVDLVSFSALDLLTGEIPYGALEPGDDTGTLSTSTVIRNTGNTGLDQEVRGESMCGTYTVSTECPVSASSTIPEFEQQFASTSVAYDGPLATALSSSSPQEVELDILKTTSTSSPQQGTTYWGIAVPITITLAGSYEGLNTLTARTAEPADWTP